MASERPSSEDIVEEVMAHAADDLAEQLIAEHRSIPQDTREGVLERDNEMCQIRGCRAQSHFDSTQLLVLKIADDPEECAEDDAANLEVRCLRCARWVEQMPSRDDLPDALRTQLDDVDLQATWVEILEYLAQNGPATTGEITDAVSDLSSTVGVRRALYALMSFDVREPSIEQPLVVKDAVDGSYGLRWQINDERNARGRIPLRPSERRIRIIDEIVRRLYDALGGETDNVREIIAEVVDRDSHQTYHMRRRAEAFQFPFVEWADTQRPQQDSAAVIEAIDVIAGSTDNVSRQLVSRTLIDLLESNDESDLARQIREWVLDDTTTSETNSVKYHHYPQGHRSSRSEGDTAERGDLNGIELEALEKIPGDAKATSKDGSDEITRLDEESGGES